MHYKNIFLSFILIFLISLNVGAQRFEIGIVGGGAGYIGDLNQNNPLKISGITAGAFAKINFTPFVGLGLYYNYGNIKGDDLKSKNQQFINRGINFNTKLQEVSLITDVNFLDILSPVSKRTLTPYVFVGIGGVLFNSKAKYGNQEFILIDMQTNSDVNGNPISYRPYAITIPYGAGAKYRLTDNLTLSSQIGYRTVLSDYIDDVGDYYNYPANTPSGTPVYFPPYKPTYDPMVGAPGTERGDLRKRDTYMFVSVGISYTFVSQKCFTF